MTLKKFKIGDICLTTDYVANGSFASLKENVKYLDNEGYAILVRLTDFTKHWKKSFRYVSKHAYEFLKHSKLYPGDLIISSVGEPGKTFLVPDLGKPMTLGPNSVLIRPDNKILSTQYLKYFLDSDFGQELIKSIVSGTAQRKFNKTSLRNLEITIPGLEVQQQIVAKLDAVFVKINKTIKSTEKAIELAKINLNNIIDARTTFRQNWKKYKVSDLGLVQTGNTPKTSNKESFGDYIPFIKPPNFKKNGTIEVTKDGLSKEGAEFSRKANANSVMMVCIGATIGKVAINDEDVCFNQQINSLTPIKEYDAELIYWQMRGNRFQAEVQKNAGQATLPIISKSKWQSIDIFLPESLNEQIEIRVKLRKLCDYIDSYSKIKSQKLIELNKLKLSILVKELKPREVA